MKHYLTTRKKKLTYDELYGDYKYKVDEAKPKKATGEKISKEVFFAKLKGKTRLPIRVMITKY